MAPDQLTITNLAEYSTLQTARLDSSACVKLADQDMRSYAAKKRIRPRPLRLQQHRQYCEAGEQAEGVYHVFSMASSSLKQTVSSVRQLYKLAVQHSKIPKRAF
jgi:hypothetical protein